MTKVSIAVGAEKWDVVRNEVSVWNGEEWVPHPALKRPKLIDDTRELPSIPFDNLEFNVEYAIVYHPNYDNVGEVERKGHICYGHIIGKNGEKVVLKVTYQRFVQTKEEIREVIYREPLNTRQIILRYKT